MTFPISSGTTNSETKYFAKSNVLGSTMPGKSMGGAEGKK
jgi:hypothetical protein